MKKLDEWLLKGNAAMMAKIYLREILPLFLIIALILSVLEAIFMD